MIVPPKQFKDEENRVQKEFIWDNKHPKIKQGIMIGDYSVGGSKICALGVYHSYDPFIALNHNFLEIVKKLRECLSCRQDSSI